MTQINHPARLDFSPRGHLVAVVAGQAANAAIADLRAAGLTANAADLLAENRANRNGPAGSLWKRGLAALATFFPAEENDARREYEDAARRGFATLVVAARDRATIARARAILHAHHAAALRHYGAWTITDFA